MANGTLAASQIEMLSQSGTGIITITPPATNTNRAITLPDAAGAIVVSGTTPSLNGITFPATQVASADANTLDDYEEGTWTPTVLNGGVGITVTTASYTKIGRLVYLQLDVTIGSTANIDAFTITSLPFSVGGGRVAGAAIGYNNSGTNMAALISSSNLEFYLAASATSATNAQASGDRFIVAASYQV
jgi:hypothetical protein